MTEDTKVDEQKMKEVVFYAVKQWFRTDVTDYDNWCGIREFGSAITKWYNEGIPKEDLGEVKKILHKAPKVYKKVFWKVYKQV